MTAHKTTSPLDDSTVDASSAPLGQPSQDPRPEAQEPMDRDTAQREENSVLMGGGMAAGAAAGVAIGTAVAGPVGTLVGGTVGAILGALGGYAAVDAADPDYTYWKDHHAVAAGSIGDRSYEQDYAPAYRLGYQGHTRYADESWEQVAPHLRTDWDALRDHSRLTWAEAEQATRAAWQRAKTSPPTNRA